MHGAGLLLWATGPTTTGTLRGTVWSMLLPSSAPYGLRVTSASTKHPSPPAGPSPGLSKLPWVRDSQSSREKYSSCSGQWEGSLELSTVAGSSELRHGSGGSGMGPKSAALSAQLPLPQHSGSSCLSRKLDSRFHAQSSLDPQGQGFVPLRFIAAFPASRTGPADTYLVE